MTGRIAFIAEAPAQEEVDAGNIIKSEPIPLVGASGRLFGRLLRMAGLASTQDMPSGFRTDVRRIGLQSLLWERNAFFIGNVWPYQIPDNELANLFAKAQEARDGNFGEAEWYMGGYGWLRPEHRGALDKLARELAEFITKLADNL